MNPHGTNEHCNTSNHPGRAHELLELGTIVGTPGFLALFPNPQASHDVVNDVLSRYISADWGVLDASDCAANDAALNPVIGGRIFAKYEVMLEGGKKQAIYVITEADRTLTTLLLPSEY